MPAMSRSAGGWRGMRPRFDARPVDVQGEVPWALVEIGSPTIAATRRAGDRRLVPVAADQQSSRPRRIRGRAHRSGAVRWIAVRELVPLGRGLRDHRAADHQQDHHLGSRTSPDSPLRWPARDRLAPHDLRPPSPIAPARRPTPRRAASALIVAVAFAVTSVGLLARAEPDGRVELGPVQLDVGEAARQPDEPVARRRPGLRALKVDSTLTSIARWRSKDMIVRGYFSHNIPPSGYNVFAVLDTKGYCYAIAGENIGWNNYPDNIATETVHRQFMKSPGHRSNILGKRWDVIGIGAYKGPTGKKMWTVLFADKCGGSSGGGTTHEDELEARQPSPTPKATPKPTPKPTPVPTPVRTMPPEPTDPVGLGFGARRARTNENGAGSGDGGPARRPGDRCQATAGSLRVVDPRRRPA